MFLGQDLLAYAVDIFKKTDIRSDEDILPAGFELLAFGDNAVCCILRTTNEVNLGGPGLLGEGLEGIFTYSAGGADKNSHHPCRKAVCELEAWMADSSTMVEYRRAA